MDAKKKEEDCMVLVTLIFLLALGVAPFPIRKKKPAIRFLFYEAFCRPYRVQLG